MKSERCAVCFGIISVLSGIYILAPVGGAEKKDASVEILPRWKEGEKLTFELTKSRQKSQAGRRTLTASMRQELDVEVVKATGEGYLLRLTFREARFDDPRQAENPIVRETANLFKDLQVELAVDSQGSMHGIQNWKELKELSSKVLDRLTKTVQDAGLDPATAAKLRAEVGSMFETKEQVERACTKEVGMLFLPLGKTYAPSKPIESEDELPNPFGGEPLPSRGEFALKSFDKESGRAEITWKAAIAPEKAKRALEKALRDMTARLGKPAPDEQLLKKVTIESSVEFSVDVSSGWVESLRQVRETRMDSGSQEEILTMRRRTKS